MNTEEGKTLVGYHEGGDSTGEGVVMVSDDGGDLPVQLFQEMGGGGGTPAIPEITEIEDLIVRAHGEVPVVQEHGIHLDNR
jgi:hypothetical protein